MLRKIDTKKGMTSNNEFIVVLSLKRGLAEWEARILYTTKLMVQI
jgi:hypothetical protein